MKETKKCRYIPFYDRVLRKIGRVNQPFKIFWAFGVILTNSYRYIIYTTIYDKEGVEPKHHLSHYEFLEEVGLYWMNPTLMELMEDDIDYGKQNSSPSTAISTLTQDSSVATSRKRKVNSTISTTT